MRVALGVMVAASFVSFGCGGSQQPNETEHHDAHSGGHDAHSEHGAHSGHGAHAEHGGHGHHDHSSPEALEPLMRDLYASMLTLRSALDEGQVEAAAAPAHAIAVACDDQDVHQVDPEQFGPRFAEIDGDLHRLAATMAEATEAGELDTMRESYGTLLDTCGACHAQAPTATEVDLSGLAPTW